MSRLIEFVLSVLLEYNNLRGIPLFRILEDGLPEKKQERGCFDRRWNWRFFEQTASRATVEELMRNISR